MEMFREMRRKKQELPRGACEEILARGTAGVLSLMGEDGYPYGVPLSYVYFQGKLYFHSAKSGHKIDALARNPKASFCVIDRAQVVPEEYTTYFRSVIVFGRVRVLEEDGEKWAAINALAQKYAPWDTEENRRAAIQREWAPLWVLEMVVDHMTGKEAIELVRRGGSAEISLE